MTGMQPDPWATGRKDGGYWDTARYCGECDRIYCPDLRYCTYCGDDICVACAQKHAARCWPAEPAESESAQEA